MDHTAPAPDSPAAQSRARTPRRCNADYRWTEPKVIAFLEALSRCGKVAEAARAVGMSDTSAYRLRARMGSARFDAAFEGARRNGIRARIAASRARLAAPSSPWDGLGIAQLAARERACAQGKTLAAQGAGLPGQGGGLPSQGGGLPGQGAAFARKVPV